MRKTTRLSPAFVLALSCVSLSSIAKGVAATSDEMVGLGNIALIIVVWC